MPTRPRLLNPHTDPHAIDQAAAVLRAGGVVAFPTETVYGLGADATNPQAVARIFAIKGRPTDHPVIVHLPDAAAMTNHARRVPATARILAERFWPGPLTLILERTPQVPDTVTGGLDTVGLRVPSHPIARALLAAFGGGVAAPSANRFGTVSATTTAHVMESLQAFMGDTDVVLDGGTCPVGVESTIVDLSTGSPRVLRPGGVSVEDLQQALGHAVPVVENATTRAPGTLPSHYAPRARVELCEPSRVLARITALSAAGQKAGVLTAFMPPDLPADVVRIVLPEAGAAAATRLYQALRDVDQAGLDVVLVCLPPETGVARAVADRLRRAAGPRA